ncbi:MAG: YqaA family protein [Hydrogenovibrio sp.]|uniref:YqaA family protein n=1 Tax=Hydrogenovibrio sp. TaxID=2065821 RepID=UPI002870A125|nr:YqaA family protein [Hydrogenovibrio sp.]MDR9498405.1 YqaA family protein [Hydrogenovibrio sp.]
MTVYASLFAVSLLAATLFPAGSEALLLALASQGHNLWWLWAVATLGNSLGSVVNYLIGRYLLHFQDRKWFPVSPQQLHRSQDWFQRYGLWALLLAWLPIVGDPLTLIAGVMRTPFWLFALLVTLGKALRYGVLLGLLQLWTG